MPSPSFFALYTDLGERFQAQATITIEHHIENIFAIICNGVVSFVTDNSSKWDALGNLERDFWLSFVNQFFRGEAQVKKVFLSRYGESHGPVFTGTLSAQEKFVRIQPHLQKLGFERLILLVDGFLDQSAAEQQNLREQLNLLMNTKSLFTLPSVSWKFFLPAILDEWIQTTHVFRSAQIGKPIQIKWSPEKLRELLRNRLIWASRKHDLNEIAALCEQELIAEFSPIELLTIEDCLAEMALRHKHYGAPGAILKMAQRLIEYTENRKGGSSLISKDDWNNFLNEVQKELNSEEGRTLAMPSPQEVDSAWIIKSRADTLRNNIVESLRLLSEYEKKALYEDDPKRKAHYRDEIQDSRTRLFNFQREYQTLETYLHGPSHRTNQELQLALEQINALLSKLSDDDRVIIEGLDTILEEQSRQRKALIAMHEDIRNQYEKTQQEMLSRFIDALDQKNADLVQTILDARQTNELDLNEMHDLVSAFKNALETLNARDAQFANLQDAKEIFTSPTLDIQHQFELSIPIIPFLLTYKGTVGAKAGLELENTWNALVRKVSKNR